MAGGDYGDMLPRYLEQERDSIAFVHLWSLLPTNTCVYGYLNRDE
jgi:hypothetical protein